MKKLLASVLFALAFLAGGPAIGQGSSPGQFVVPLGHCQLSASQLGSAVALKSCVRASFTASAGSPATQLVVTSVSGIINPGDVIVSGTGATVGTVILSQISGTPGGAGTYLLSATNTTSSAAVTSGGIPTGATMALIQAETADVRWRDDGGVPATSVGGIIVHGIAPLFYSGPLSKMQFIALSGSPLLDIAFYR